MSVDRELWRYRVQDILKEMEGEQKRAPGREKLEAVNAKTSDAFLVSGQLIVAFMLLGVAGGLWTRNVNTGIGISILGLALGAGLLAFRSFGDTLVWWAEVKVARDINKDKHVGKPEERTILLNARKETPEPVVTDSALATFVRGCADGTSERSWAARGLGREEWERHRNALIDGKWAAWDNADAPTQGWHLTATVDNILAALS